MASQNTVNESGSDSLHTVACPVCNREFKQEAIEEHVHKCLFLNTQSESSQSSSKRAGPHLENPFPQEKRLKLSPSPSSTSSRYRKEPETTTPKGRNVQLSKEASTKEGKAPLAEQMRPLDLNDLVGQKEAFGARSMLRSMLEQKKIPNMILWGPPGCGKTSLANVVANICKVCPKLRFVKLSATMAGINDVKEVVKVAKNEIHYKRQTILFMDEIHRFNKLQQDTFLPHVENGTIILIGATTENPSFSLNNALLSRCRVVVMEKLSVEEVMVILERALKKCNACVVDPGKMEKSNDEIPRCLIERESLRWLAEVCDGDARVALGALEVAVTASDTGQEVHTTGPAVISVEDMKEGIKRSHMLYDRKGDEHYNTVSAIHKSIRAGDDNAALYWTARAMQGGEDPIYIARRLVRAASEDIGLGDPNALVEAVATLQGCQLIGMPECDVLLAQCAVRLARATKSTEVYHAMKRCQSFLKENKGPLPPVPLHLRNASTKLMEQLGYGRGYNTMNKNESGLSYMPDGVEHVDFFNNNGLG